MPIVTKVEDLMAKEVITVNLEDTIKKADDLMHQENIKQIPVIDEGKLIGVITERNIMEYTLKKLYDADDDFGDDGYNNIIDFEKIMSKNVNLIYPEDSIKKAVEIMVKKKVDFLPVVDWENNLVGMITSHDVLMFFHKKFIEGKL
jgi:acetoin utilization protein AcuB